MKKFIIIAAVIAGGLAIGAMAARQIGQSIELYEIQEQIDQDHGLKDSIQINRINDCRELERLSNDGNLTAYRRWKDLGCDTITIP